MLEHDVFLNLSTSVTKTKRQQYFRTKYKTNFLNNRILTSLNVNKLV